MAKIEMDVIQLSGGSRAPVYLDFVLVHVGSENELRTDLQVDLHQLVLRFCKQCLLLLLSSS